MEPETKKTPEPGKSEPFFKFISIVNFILTYNCRILILFLL